MELFARRLKERAAALGISNAQAARLCGLDERRYANYANNQREPDLATLAKIAKVLGVSVDYLLGAADPERVDQRQLLMQRLSVAAGGLSSGQLAMIVTQVEAVTFPRPSSVGRKMRSE